MVNNLSNKINQIILWINFLIITILILQKNKGREVIKLIKNYNNKNVKHIYRNVIFVFAISVVVSSVICFQLIQAKGEDVKSSLKNDIATV